MENLPIEVLSHVFIFTIPRHDYREQYVSETTNKPQASLSLVCRYWEQVVIKTPQVWSYIHLSRESTKQTLRRQIELSSREPLDVRVNVGYGSDVDSSTTFPGYYQILLETIDRWRSFVFQGIVPFPHSPMQWIPELLPNVVEAAYYGLVEDDTEGLQVLDDDSGELTESRFKPWTAAPKLRRFVVDTPGQFLFLECPLVTELSVSDVGQWWGGSSNLHSWHDKWGEYFTRLAELCPQLEILELSGSRQFECREMIGWRNEETTWPRFSYLRALKVDAINSPTIIPVILKFNAQNLLDFHLSHIHYCLPHPFALVTLSIEPSSCQVHFDKSPLHAIKLFLEGLSHVHELNISVQLSDALGISTEVFSFVDERGNDARGEAERIKEDWTWIKEHTGSVQWIFPPEIPGPLLTEGELSSESAAALAMTWRMMSLGGQAAEGQVLSPSQTRTTPDLS